jgi:hypothetical protein
MDPFWELIEDENFRTSLEMICEDVLSLAPAIAIIDHGLRRNPTKFRQIPGFGNVYIAKTKVIITPDFFVPALRLWFAVDEAAHEVHKTWIDLVPVEELDGDPETP